MGDSSSTKAFLGVGWRFPVAPVGGRLQYSAHETNIEEAVRSILLTVPGERVMLPELGAGLPAYLFEPNSPATRSHLAAEVKRALIDWEPRIDVDRIEVSSSDDDPNLLLIHVDYVVRATNTFYNRVYPFYLLEGRT
jgi:phage baseplate assembly protein W